MRYLSIMAALLLFGCGTTFTPKEYELRDGLIAPIAVNGEVATTNGQQDSEPVVVYSYMGSKNTSDLHSITEVMVQQTRKEISKAARPKPGKPKTIELKVTRLFTKYAGFHFNSLISFSAKLGNGQVVDKGVPYTNGFLDLAINGSIAEGVMVLLNDGQVRAYLAQ